MNRVAASTPLFTGQRLVVLALDPNGRPRSVASTDDSTPLVGELPARGDIETNNDSGTLGGGAGGSGGEDKANGHAAVDTGGDEIEVGNEPDEDADIPPPPPPPLDDSPTPPPPPRTKTVETAVNSTKKDSGSGEIVELAVELRSNAVRGELASAASASASASSASSAASGPSPYATTVLCPRCTFANPTFRGTCEMCEATLDDDDDEKGEKKRDVGNGNNSGSNKGAASANAASKGVASVADPARNVRAYWEAAAAEEGLRGNGGLAGGCGGDGALPPPLAPNAAATAAADAATPTPLRAAMSSRFWASISSLTSLAPSSALSPPTATSAVAAAEKTAPLSKNLAAKDERAAERRGGSTQAASAAAATTAPSRLLSAPPPPSSPPSLSSNVSADAASHGNAALSDAALGDAGGGGGGKSVAVKKRWALPPYWSTPSNGAAGKGSDGHHRDSSNGAQSNSSNTTFYDYGFDDPAATATAAAATSAAAGRAGGGQEFGSGSGDQLASTPPAPDASKRVETRVGPRIQGGCRSDILGAAHLLELEGLLPSLLQGYSWRLLYSSLQHGGSLGTFYAKARAQKRTLLVVDSLNGEVFGGFTSSDWTQNEGGGGSSCGGGGGALHHNQRRKKSEYFGTGESFLFSFSTDISNTVEEKNRSGVGALQKDSGGSDKNEEGKTAPSPSSLSVRYFPWTAKNHLVMLATNESIALGGGGGSFGLLLEDDFASGSTGPCETFGNDALCSEPMFQVAALELWGFSLV